MTKTAEKRKLVPKLRFPEFRGGREWECKPMGEVYSFKGNNSLSREKLNYERGSVKNVHYGDIHTKYSTLFDITKEVVPYINQAESLGGFKTENYCLEGDMIFADASEDLDDIGKCIEIVRLNDEPVVSGLHTILARQIEARFVTGFSGYLFKSKPIRAQIQNESQGTKILGLSAGRFSKIGISFPSSKEEQQKIAACLSSLDELIEAEDQKLDALKAHKKALMQDLFPREGEAMPRFRFPEFRDALDWEKMELGEAAAFYNGRAYNQEDLLDQGKYRVLRVGNFFTNKHWYYSDLELDETKYCCEGDLLYAWSASFGPRLWNGEKVIYHYHIWKVVGNKGIDEKFLYLVLERETERVKEKSANGLGLLHITKGAIENWACLFPKLDEQQKISSFLFSMNDRIAAQCDKIETLKAHKNGLMQQLFPALDESTP